MNSPKETQSCTQYCTQYSIDPHTDGMTYCHQIGYQRCQECQKYSCRKCLVNKCIRCQDQIVCLLCVAKSHNTCHRCKNK